MFWISFKFLIWWFKNLICRNKHILRSFLFRFKWKPKLHWNAIIASSKHILEHFYANLNNFHPFSFIHRSNIIIYWSIIEIYFILILRKIQGTLGVIEQKNNLWQKNTFERIQWSIVSNVLLITGVFLIKYLTELQRVVAATCKLFYMEHNLCYFRIFWL